MERFQPLTSRKMIKEPVASLEKKVREQAIQIDRIRTALDVLLERRNREKAEIYAKLYANIKKNVLPLIEGIANESLSTKSRTYLSIIKSNLEQIVSSTTNVKALSAHNFTPTEMHIIELIKKGKQSKEIADLLNVSVATISFHRNNIRIKLGLNKRRKNLFSYLKTLQN